jgi:pyruvate dehydrogenase E2 component (dihydrolipoamide acetyltransferase)
MSRIEIRIPEVGQTTSEVRLVKWHKAVGEAVRRGDVLADLETDKMVVELESFAQGTLIELLAEVDQQVGVGSVVAILETEARAPVKIADTPGPVMKREQTTQTRVVAQQSTAPRAGSRRAKASPAAKAAARPLRLDLSRLNGSGPDGLITRKDVLATARVSSERAGQESVTDRHRLATGRAMSQSKREIPHYYLEIEVCADRIEADRAVRNADPRTSEKITLTDYLIVAVARALRLHPQLNACFDKDQIILRSEVHLGLAVSTPHGLVLAAIGHADRLAGVEEAAVARRRLLEQTQAGRTGSVQPTFTLSNLGMHGITRFAAIIPPGQAAILAVGAAHKRVVLDASGLHNEQVLTLTLSIDHRVADGAESALFLNEIKRGLEAS